jgi:hypothetical protein
VISSVAEARALLAEERVLSLVAVPGFTSLVERVVGGPVKGSWWGHPRGETIYRLASALEDEALVLKAAAGKVAFVHASLWPAVLRVVTDAAFVARAERGLSPAARQLLAAVRAARRLRLDELPAPAGERKALRAAKGDLEARFLVHLASEHTARGRHEAVLRRWDDWAPGAATRAAAKLSLLSAEAELAAVGLVLG